MTAAAKTKPPARERGRSRRPVRFVCALCGEPGYGDRMINGTEGRRYCSNTRACDERAAKRAERTEAA